MTPAADHRDGLRIGELSRRTATSARSLRYYEQRGLITADREQNGYRRYGPDVVNVVNNIRVLLSAGLSVDDIDQFGSCVRSPDLNAAPCTAALDIYEQRLTTLRTKIDALEHLHATLVEHTSRLRAQLRD
ncbi:MerR family transcriptional regulator [Actinophytocola oryzae]|uniref:MerR family transcriptional regulator n=1 Tax=Actinophytocola oryzae TaxID=502181 RepID=A0A4V3FQF3_9PSEU|nr:MerR family transcriptional regulator [Actinophytocola oryzae]TDV38576.1 MerR family transcriptional regulator [Actinophytocola oryzae]